MTWDDTLKIGLGGFLAVLAQVVVQLWTDWRDRRKIRREGAISALLIAISLEEFAERCAADAHGPDPYANGPREARTAGELLRPFRIPEAPEFSEDVDWMVFQPEMADRVLSFGYVARRSVEALSRFDRASRENWIERRDSVVELGLKAIKISDEIRASSGLARRGAEHSWMPREVLEGIAGDIARLERQRREEVA